MSSDWENKPEDRFFFPGKLLVEEELFKAAATQELNVGLQQLEGCIECRQ